MLPPRYAEDTMNETILKAEKEIRDKILSLIPDFNDFQIYNIKNIQDLGKYVSGSYKKPIICVSYNSCLRASEYYEIDIYTTVITTLLHEIGHAIQECRGMKFDEEQAESVAKEYISEGTVPQWVVDVSTTKKTTKPNRVFIQIKSKS
jgi:hypothetical protein